MTFAVKTTTRFDKDYKKSTKRGKNMTKLARLMGELSQHGQVPMQHRPHILSGNWAGVWECHIEPDWLLLYEIHDNEIVLRRTGTHSDLLGK